MLNFKENDIYKKYKSEIYKLHENSSIITYFDAINYLVNRGVTFEDSKLIVNFYKAYSNQLFKK